MDEDRVKYNQIKTAHASSGTVAWVILFPIGAIVMAVSRSRAAIWIHAAIQLFGLALFTTNVGEGIWMALTVSSPLVALQSV